MAFQKGKSGNPKGRPKGTKSRVTQLREVALAKVLAKHKDPLGFLLGIMESDKASIALRIDAAKAAAPYIHKRQPIAIENSDKGPFRVFDVTNLMGLTDAELKQLRSIIAKVQPEDSAG